MASNKQCGTDLEDWLLVIIKKFSKKFALFECGKTFAHFIQGLYILSVANKETLT